MKEIILITGANGLVAKELSEKLEKDYTVRFLTRKKQNSNDFEWDIKKGTIDEKALTMFPTSFILRERIFRKKDGPMKEKKN
jgi:NAD dependent epimerase/dehydratase family enzyme